MPMVSYMKTTLNIDYVVIGRLREEAARRGTTVSALVEEGLRRILFEQTEAANEPGKLEELPSWRGGHPTVDIASREALGTVM
ncbi:MAG: hypothetical protein F4058_04000 [Rhodothermaceae bacterium]|nr:hypothetical protein [Rhodothermaceae bacterium]